MHFALVASSQSLPTSIGKCVFAVLLLGSRWILVRELYAIWGVFSRSNIIETLGWILSFFCLPLIFIEVEPHCRAVLHCTS